MIKTYLRAISALEHQEFSSVLNQHTSWRTVVILLVLILYVHSHRPTLIFRGFHELEIPE